MKAWNRFGLGLLILGVGLIVVAAINKAFDLLLSLDYLIAIVGFILLCFEYPE